MTRRRKPAPPPKETSPLGHLIDAVFFRAMAIWVLTDLNDRATVMQLIAVFFGLFFMPEALRGKNSLIAQIIRRILGGK